MLHKKICLQRLFESAFCTALISELVRMRIPDGRTGDRKWPTAKCAAVVSWYIQIATNLKLYQKGR